MDVKLELTHDLYSNTYTTDPLPSMALDSGSPCRNDGVLAVMRIASQQTIAPQHHDAMKFS